MKAKALFVAATLVAACFAQDTFTFSRSYKEGEADKFKMNVTANMALGTAEMFMNMTQTVKKVYENGDADLEMAVSDMRLVFGGNEMPTPNQQQQPQVMRFDKFGRPVGGPTGAGGGMMDQMSFLRSGFVGFDKPLTPGTEIQVDQKDEKTGTHTWGKVKLESIKDGVATVTSDLQMKSKQTGENAMTMKFTNLIDTATSKINKMTGTVTGLPTGDQGMQIDSIQVLMERTK